MTIGIADVARRAAMTAGVDQAALETCFYSLSDHGPLKFSKAAG
jgi:hypothetical protein